jgi:hypothetical protein
MGEAKRFIAGAGDREELEFLTGLGLGLSEPARGQQSEYISLRIK